MYANMGAHLAKEAVLEVAKVGVHSVVLLGGLPMECVVIGQVVLAFGVIDGCISARQHAVVCLSHNTLHHNVRFSSQPGLADECGPPWQCLLKVDEMACCGVCTESLCSQLYQNGTQCTDTKVVGGHPTHMTGVPLQGSSKEKKNKSHYIISIQVRAD